MCQNAEDPIEMQTKITRPVSKFISDPDLSQENIDNVKRKK